MRKVCSVCSTAFAIFWLGVTRSAPPSAQGRLEHCLGCRCPQLRGASNDNMPMQLARAGEYSLWVRQSCAVWNADLHASLRQNEGGDSSFVPRAIGVSENT